MVARFKAALTEHLPLLAFLFANALAQFAFYALQAGRLLRVVKEHPSLDDQILFYSYSFSLVVGIATAFYLVALAVAALARSERLSRTLVGVAVVCEALIWGLILVNHRVYTVMGVTLDSHFAITALSSRAFSRVLALSASTVATVVGVFAVAVAGQAIVYVLFRRLQGLAPARRQRVAATLLAVVLLPLSLAGWASVRWGIRVTYDASVAVEALPLFTRLIRHKTQEILALTYELPRQWPTLRRRPTIVYVQVESLREDAIVPALAPRLVRFRDREATIVSTRHYATCHTTEYNTFTNLYGLYPYHYHPFLQDKRRSFPLELLRRNGYRLAFASGTPMRDWFEMGFMLRQFDEGKEFTAKHDYRNDQHVVEFARRFYERQKKAGRPGFLFLFLGSTHHNYLYPPDLERHKPVIDLDHNLMTGDPRWEGMRLQITNRYKNSVMYLDRLFGQLEQIFGEGMRKGEVVLVFTGDHGEEFWEHGVLGHGGTRFYNPQTRVPMFVRLTGGPRRVVDFSSHVDIWPTLIDHLLGESRFRPGDYLDGVSLLRPQARDRYLVIAGNAYPYSNRRVTLVTRRHKFWLYKPTTSLTVYKPYKFTDIEDRPVQGAEVEAEYRRVLARYVHDVYRFFRPAGAKVTRVVEGGRR